MLPTGSSNVCKRVVVVVVVDGSPIAFVNEVGGCDVVGATNAEAEPAAAKELAMQKTLNFMFFWGASGEENGGLLR